MVSDVGVFVICAIMALITALSVILGWLSYKTYKMKNQFDEDEALVRYIMLLKEAEKKLNAALKIHEHRLDHQRDDIYGIQRRLDILEANHPDDEIDYGTVDDDGNITEVWFEGKRYVPEDKRDGDTVAFYADGRVMTETTRPEEKRCCATCQHYRPESGYSTCSQVLRSHVTKAYANNTHSACNNYEKLVLYKTYNGIIPDDKTEELLKRVADLNYFYNVGLMSAATYMHRWEELMQNDS